MWRKEYRIVYYSWEFDTLQSFYRDLLRLPQMYGWYTSPVDRGCKFKIGDNRLELICRHPTLPQGPAGMRLEARDIELCYANLKKEPRVTVISPLALRPWGEYSFCIKDPVGNWVEVYQRAEQYHPAGPDDGGCYFTDEYTAILFAEDLEKITAFYRDSMQMPVVTQWDRGPEDRGCRLRSAGGFTDIRQKTENTPQGPAHHRSRGCQRLLHLAGKPPRRGGAAGPYRHLVRRPHLPDLRCREECGGGAGLPPQHEGAEHPTARGAP